MSMMRWDPFFRWEFEDLGGLRRSMDRVFDELLMRTPRRATPKEWEPSIEMFDFAIGIARVQQDDFPAARAAFERALVANLGFYWAHVRLAGSALKLNDTTTALTELDQAVQMEAKDPVLRLFDGVVLHEAGREPEAATQLERAELLDPYYADPYYWLAEVYRHQGRGPDAVRQYQLFLGHATRTDPGRKLAQDQLAALGGAPPR